MFRQINCTNLSRDKHLWLGSRGPELFCVCVWGGAALAEAVQNKSFILFFFSKIAMLMMISLQDHYCTIYTPFHFAPESSHIFYIAAAHEMTEGDVICILDKLSRCTYFTNRYILYSLCKCRYLYAFYNFIKVQYPRTRD